jgi:hypothetical protein
LGSSVGDLVIAAAASTTGRNIMASPNRLSAAVAFGPTHKAIRFLLGALKDGVGPIHQQRDPLGIAGGLVTVIETIEKWTDEPAQFFAHFGVTITNADLGQDFRLPARQPDAGTIRVHQWCGLRRRPKLPGWWTLGQTGWAPKRTPAFPMRVDGQIHGVSFGKQNAGVATGKPGLRNTASGGEICGKNTRRG